MKITLDDIQAAIEKKYAPLTLEVRGEEFVLVSLLRLPRKVREAVEAKFKEMGGEVDENGEAKVDTNSVSEEEMVKGMQFVLSSVTKDNRGARLVHLLPDDILVLTELMNSWQEATQPGEA